MHCGSVVKVRAWGCKTFSVIHNAYFYMTQMGHFIQFCIPRIYIELAAVVTVERTARQREHYSSVFYWRMHVGTKLLVTVRDSMSLPHYCSMSWSGMRQMLLRSVKYPHEVLKLLSFYTSRQAYKGHFSSSVYICAACYRQAFEWFSLGNVKITVL